MKLNDKTSLLHDYRTNFILPTLQNLPLLFCTNVIIPTTMKLYDKSSQYIEEEDEQI